LKDNWRHHGSKIEDAGQIWIAAIGPDTPPLVELKNSNTLYKMQLATTISSLLGLNFISEHSIADPINSIYK